MYEIDDKKYPCSTSVTMHFIGGKWKAVILIHLVDGDKRYNALRKLIPTITERTLSLQLKQLENDGLISRQVHTDKPPLMVVYRLTDFGQTLIPVLESIAAWGRTAASDTEKITHSPEVENCGVFKTLPNG